MNCPGFKLRLLNTFALISSSSVAARSCNAFPSRTTASSLSRTEISEAVFSFRNASFAADKAVDAKPAVKTEAKAGVETPAEKKAEVKAEKKAEKKAAKKAKKAAKKAKKAAAKKAEAKTEAAAPEAGK